MSVAALLVAPSSAGAAIAFVAAASAGNTAGATTLSITKPTGTANGHVLVATVVATGTGAVTVPSGWIVARDTTLAGARMITAYRVAASEGTSYAWALGTSRTASGGIVAYSGVNTTVPVEATASATGTSGNAVSASVTTVTTNTLVVTGLARQASTTHTALAGTTERYDVTSNATAAASIDAAQAAAAASTVRTVATASTTAAWGAQTIALRDAANASLSVAANGSPTAFSGSIDAADTSGSYSLPFTVTDTRTGATAALGWNLTITSTRFINAASKSLAANVSSLTGATLTCANGGICDTPPNSVTYPITIPAGLTAPAAVKMFSAPVADGEGYFTLALPVTIALPQNSYTGSFSSTVTLSVVSGP